MSKPLKKSGKKNNTVSVNLLMLKKVPIFSGLSEEELSMVVEFSEIVEYDSMDEIFIPGDHARHSYVVLSGAVEILRQEHVMIMGVSPEESLIARMLPGDSFGEMELLTDDTHNAIARVPDNAQIMVFPARETTIHSLLRSNCSLGARMLFSFLKSTASRQRQALNVIKENSPEIQELRRQVYGDKLTGLFNKTYLEEEMPQLISKHKQLALLMFKPDNFKQINDTYGHEAGDQVIVRMAAELANFAGEGNTALRYMGNELAVVLPGLNRKKALKKAEEIRNLINSLDISSSTNGEPFCVTVSFGISLYPEHSESADEIIALAHELPLIGRGRGGNKILFPEDR